MSDYQLLIDGKMVDGDQTMPVLNPATEEVLAQCPRASKNQLDQAVALILSGKAVVTKDSMAGAPAAAPAAAPKTAPASDQGQRQQ